MEYSLTKEIEAAYAEIKKVLILILMEYSLTIPMPEVLYNEIGS